MKPLVQSIEGKTAAGIALSLESLIAGGTIPPAGRLPPVRELSARLRVSPSTVAAAYRTLRMRGLLSGAGRRGTRVTPRPPVRTVQAPVPKGLRNVADGNPNGDLLPALPPVLRRLRSPIRLYGESLNRPDLLEIAAAHLGADGIPADHVAIVGGALDGLERALQAHLRPGDRIAVEDPGFTGVLDLIGALGLVPEPVPIDDFGPRPEGVEQALKRGASGIILTPRAENPRGSALDEKRARELRKVLERHPDALVLEDDHAWAVAGQPSQTVTQGRKRWAVVRSVAKSLGPDLRLAFLAGDALTVSRVEGRQAVGTGWVSHLLQETVAVLLADPGTEGFLANAASSYAERRQALVDALRAEGIEACGRSGFNCWIPVPKEVPMVTAMAAAGWAIRGTESYRLKSSPAVRVTVSSLRPSECAGFAKAFAQALRGRPLTQLT